jgi:hypothetical protein
MNLIDQDNRYEDNESAGKKISEKGTVA